MLFFLILCIFEILSQLFRKVEMKCWCYDRSCWKCAKKNCNVCVHINQLNFHYENLEMMVVFCELNSTNIVILSSCFSRFLYRRLHFCDGRKMRSCEMRSNSVNSIETHPTAPCKTYGKMRDKHRITLFSITREITANVGVIR